MSMKCTQYSAQFKAKGTLAVAQNENTSAQLASRSDIQPTMIPTWKRPLLDCAAELFDKTTIPANRLKARSLGSFGRPANSR